METKKIVIDDEEIEIALKLDKEYYENNINLENTLNLTEELKKLQVDESNE